MTGFEDDELYWRGFQTLVGSWDAYASAAAMRFAAWVHESDEAGRDDLQRRGYVLDTATRVMDMALSDVRLPRPAMELEEISWREYLEYEGLPADFLADADHAALHPLAVRVDGRIAAAALAFDEGSDCGIYNVGTHEALRRRGLGTAVTVAQLYRARERGCLTASLQSTQMAERVYKAAGFRDLGRFLEFVPAP